MKKINRWLCALVGLSTAVMLCACERFHVLPNQRQTDAVQTVPQTTKDTELETTEPSTEDTTERTTEEETTAEAVDEIPFYQYSSSETDPNGYQIEQVIQLSPWISQNDASAVDAAWSKVSRGKAFPTLSEMGITNNYVIADFGKNYIEFDEVLFTVGTIDIYNRTEGFPISSTNPCNVDFYLSGANRFNTLTILFGNGSRTYYSVAGGFFGTQGGGWSPIRAKMQSDHWGPVPFIIAQAIDKTPNNPNGNPACTDVVFRFGEATFSLPRWPEKES